VAENPWDIHAADWDAHDGPRRYARAAFGSLRAVLDERGVVLEGSRVLDFGCGTGLLTELLADRAGSITAVDTSTAMLAVLADKARERGWSAVTTSDRLPDGIALFDLVVCSSVLAFVDDHVATVRRLAALLDPGGLLVQWDWERDVADLEGSGLTRTEIEQALGAAGMSDVEVAEAFTLELDGEVMRPLIGVAMKRPAPRSTAGP
jgi:2-polyprenyl-3-methyl-5-hydroxy-6-metoxy-1,4-benzoquinol methylase